MKVESGMWIYRIFPACSSVSIGRFGQRHFNAKGALTSNTYNLPQASEFRRPVLYGIKYSRLQRHSGRFCFLGNKNMIKG